MQDPSVVPGSQPTTRGLQTRDGVAPQAVHAPKLQEASSQYRVTFDWTERNKRFPCRGRPEGEDALARRWSQMAQKPAALPPAVQAELEAVRDGVASMARYRPLFAFIENSQRLPIRHRLGEDGFAQQWHKMAKNLASLPPAVRARWECVQEKYGVSAQLFAWIRSHRRLPRSRGVGEGERMFYEQWWRLNKDGHMIADVEEIQHLLQTDPEWMRAERLGDVEMVHARLRRHLSELCPFVREFQRLPCISEERRLYELWLRCRKVEEPPSDCVEQLQMLHGYEEDMRRADGANLESEGKEAFEVDDMAMRDGVLGQSDEFVQWQSHSVSVAPFSTTAEGCPPCPRPTLVDASLEINDDSGGDVFMDGCSIRKRDWEHMDAEGLALEQANTQGRMRRRRRLTLANLELVDLTGSPVLL